MTPIQSEWQFEKQIDIGEISSLPVGPSDQEKDLTAIAALLASDTLTSHLQPIFSARSGKVFGYEALLRIAGDNPFGSIADIFRRAIATGCISALDARCLETAVMTAHRFALHEQPVSLFVNVCPETLMNPDISFESIDRLVDLLGFRKEQIILEITEESVVSNYEYFRESLAGFRRKGYKVAIDDFGAGYCGLKMLSTIEPDFVKIDRHFISGIDRTLVKFNLVDAIAMACHRIGIRVVGEGVEREEELRSLMSTGIELFQGNLLGLPSHEPVPRERVCPHFAEGRRGAGPELGELRYIGDIAVQLEPLASDASIGEAFKRFTHDKGLKGLPVVRNDAVVGMLNRGRFLENDILGRFGFGFAMNAYKKVTELMEESFLLFEANTTFEEVSKRVQQWKTSLPYENICVTRNGRYWGIVDMNKLLDAVIEKNISLAKGCNPLSSLPGNNFIQQEISARIDQNMHFDVGYVDIDNFKPFNDNYGFERGDFVIRTLGDIITRALAASDSEGFGFAGHIGGDDFIFLTRPTLSAAVAEQITAEFEAMLPEFHGRDDAGKGGYQARNRRGGWECMPLLSLSIGIVSTDVCNIRSYPQLASIATEVKWAAKMREGFSIVRDQRMNPPGAISSAPPSAPSFLPARP